jgi:hypothetical protein
MAFDGIWLQGFADVRGADHEEYGWLFRIYASEQGEGRLDWNHNYIARKVFAGYGPATMLPATDRRLYDCCSIRPRDILMTALSVNTRHFMPEILGSNLGIEASGVGGSYLDGWKANIGEGGNKWAALSSRLHNTVDNYDNGHTKWSLAAVQSYMARVEGATPGAVQREWHRIWRLFRLHEILEHGSEEERKAIEQSQGVST